MVSIDTIVQLIVVHADAPIILSEMERTFVKDRHVHRFRVRRGEIGWHVREERDATVIHEGHLNDWHRVELAVRLFERTAKALRRDGWSEQADANAGGRSCGSPLPESAGCATKIS